MKKSQGFTLIEILLVIVIVALIGLVGYNLYSLNTRSQQAATTPEQQADTTAPAITTTSDLDKAAATLDANDPSANATELDQLQNDASF